MKSSVIIILIVLCVLLAFAYFLVNTPFILNTMLPKFINEKAQGFKIEEFECASQTSQLPDILVMKGVSMKVRRDGRVFDIQAKKVVVHNFAEFVKEQELLRLSSQGVYVTSEYVEARGGQFKAVIGLNDWHVRFLEGAGFFQEMEVGPYRLVKTTGHIKMNPKKIEIFDIHGKFSDGDFTGQLIFGFQPQFGYLVWAEFYDIQAQAVAAPYPEFFSAIQGALSGSIRVVGSQQVDIFTINIKGKKGLAISPKAFLKMKGAFEDEEVAQLIKLDQSGATLLADQASLLIQNGRDQSVMLVFDIEEAQENLILKGKFPFSWPEGFESFLFPIKKP